ncbi:metal-dependent hydrolase family protein [Amycolatopsis pigmentata]|uniref:Amidohydrolase family protein n=1 Tax=Amycolatopsis pigmentata TaxID=450801 RepID=A0ABW5FN69_9PSEU
MIVLDNCLMFDGDSAELTEGSRIVVEEGMIREIAKAGGPSGRGKVIDMGGRFVMPGLIDAHFHSYWYEWDATAIDATPPQLRILYAKRLLEATLRRGFTTVRDAGGGDVTIARALELDLIDGPRFFYPGQALTQSGGHADLRGRNHYGPDLREITGCAYAGTMSRTVDGPDEMRRVVREHLRQGATHIKLHTSGCPFPIEEDPVWYTQFTPEEIRVAVDETTRRRRYVMAHAHSNEAAIMCAENGVRSIEHVSSIEADGARAIAAHDAFAVPTLAALSALVEAGPGMGLAQPLLEGAKEKAQRALTSIELLRAAGARIGFGTDLCGVFGDRQLTEFRLRSEVCTPLETLRSATSVNARIMRREGELGTIAVGAHADLLAIDGNPLENIHVLTEQNRIAMVMRGGKIITGLPG